jgi:hypothetical protein
VRLFPRRRLGGCFVIILHAFISQKIESCSCTLFVPDLHGLNKVDSDVKHDLESATRLNVHSTPFNSGNLAIFNIKMTRRHRVRQLIIETHV